MYGNVPFTWPAALWRVGDTKIDDLRGAVIGYEEVFCRDVAVNDVKRLTIGIRQLVCCVKSFASLRDDSRHSSGEKG